MIFFSPVYFLIFFYFSIFFFLLGFAPTASAANNNFVTDNSFSSVFGNQDQQSSKCFTSEVGINGDYITSAFMIEGIPCTFVFLFLPSLLVHFSSSFCRRTFAAIFIIFLHHTSSTLDT